MTQDPKTTVIQSVSRWLPQTATWLYNQVRFLPSEFESHIVCEATVNLDQFPHPYIHSVSDLPRWRYVWDKGVRKIGFRRHLQFLTSVAKETRARLLHSHFGDYGWRDSGATKKMGVKHVVTFYGLDVVYFPTRDSRWRTRYHELFDRVDRVLCEGPHMARCIIDLGCAPEKVGVHHLGIDVGRIAFQPRVWKGNEPLRVLMAGSFREKKGFPIAIEALGALQDEVPLEITIIGDEHGEPRTIREKEAILGAIERHALGSNTRLLGYQPYEVVLDEAYRHHIFLSPSVTAADGDTEGGAPITLIEMSAAGMMVVSTRHCDIPGVVLDGVTGLLAEERDVEGLVKHLRWLARHTQRWESMAVAGRKHVEAEFDARIQGERLGDIYRELVGV